MEISDLQEELVKLFLRLNGYFTTGLILHSKVYGQNLTEIDVIGIRLPYHKQQDRVVPSCEYLQMPNNTIDIILGEVKGGFEQNQFNSSLRKDRSAVEKMVYWIGAFNEEEIDAVVDKIVYLIQPSPINTPKDFKTLNIKASCGNFSLRPIVFAPDAGVPKRNQTRFVYGQLIVDYIWECFRPERMRDECSTVYNYEMWGSSIYPIVEYFKDRSRTSRGTVSELYAHLGFKTS